MLRVVVKLLRSFRLIALLEGASYVLLLGIAMPLKYWADLPEAVRIVGSLHGALFVAYGASAGLLLLRRQWSFARFAAAMGVSVVPLATFVFDRSIRRELAAIDPTEESIVI
jgi:integral membrane protein